MKTDPHFTAKAPMFKTAQATVSCARFSSGQYVSVKHDWTDENGINWFLIDRTENGPIDPVLYPEHHLTAFCL